MSEERTDFNLSQFNAGDLLKRYIVTQVFKTLDDACKKQETISDESFNTSFTTRVDMIESLLWKYTPLELRETIIKLYNDLDKKIKEIDEDVKLSQKNKIINKKNIAFEYKIEVFKLLTIVLTNSPISVEYAEMEVMGDFKDLIENIRQPDKVKLFTEVST